MEGQRCEVHGSLERKQTYTNPMPRIGLVKICRSHQTMASQRRHHMFYWSIRKKIGRTLPVLMSCSPFLYYPSFDRFNDLSVRGLLPVKGLSEAKACLSSCR